MFTCVFCASCFGIGVPMLVWFPTVHAFAIWILLHMIMLPVIMIGLDKPWGLRMLSWCVPRTQLVRTMQKDGETIHMLAYGEPGHMLKAHIYWLPKIGQVYLHPNGYVSGVSYVYFWEPVNVHHAVSMHLTHDCADWDKLKHMNWGDREDYRLLLKSQTKLNHESHI